MSDVPNANPEEDIWRLPNTAKGRDTRIGKGSEGTRSPSLSAAAKDRLRRVVHRAPEVMVKITGRTRGIAHLKAHLDYVTRNGKIVAETQDGQRIESRAELRALHDDWLQANAVMARGRNSAQAVQSVAVILSMPKGTPVDHVQDAARNWARETFADRHDWIMARHDDKGHPHVHVTVRAVGQDGKRLVAGPAELQQWRERFARELRRYGIEAEATPRKARGKVQKADPMPVYKITTRGRTPAARGRERHSASIEATAPKPRKPYTWEAEIQTRQHSIRTAYLQHAAELAKGDAADRKLANDIERFVADMPVPLTRRQALAVELRRVTEQRHAIEQRRPVEAAHQDLQAGGTGTEPRHAPPTPKREIGPPSKSRR